MEKNNKKELSEEELKIIEEKNAFLDDYRKISDKHGLDFGIEYEFDRYKGIYGKFIVIKKPEKE